MVKFKYLIHKGTGTVIKYEDWKSYVENELRNMYIEYGYNKDLKAYCTKEMIFSEDFEIVYDSEFSNLELISLYGNCATRETRLKLKKRIDQNQNLKREHEIEL